jgi:murein L,D-transpeptidase YafK
LTVVGLALAALSWVWMDVPQAVREVRRELPRSTRRIFLPRPKTTGPALRETLREIGWEPGSPVYLRIFKQESELELWGRHRGQWQLLKTFAICDWSGELGPKNRQGDRQSPEGFYVIGRKQLNPNSSYHLAFNLGYPNAVERARGWTGSALMVHGDCVSLGCYAITDPGIEELYGVVEDALRDGQDGVPVHAFPFRMSVQALQEHRHDEAFGFWRTLAPAYQLFEARREPPVAHACGEDYAVTLPGVDPPAGCARLEAW